MLMVFSFNCCAETIEHVKSTPCSEIITLHGYLSRAQFQCGFKRYSEKMMTLAKNCSADYADDQVKNFLKIGMGAFDSDEQETGGRVKICEFFKDRYSEFLN